VLDYRDKTGRKHIETASADKKEAEKMLIERLASLNKRTQTGEKAIEFDAYAGKWSPRKKNIKESTRTSYAGHIANHLIPYFREIKLHQIEREDINNFIEHEEKQGKSAKTIHNVLITLHQILIDGMVDGYVDRDPFIRISKPKREKRPIDCLNLEEVNALLTKLQEINDDHFLLIRLAIETGMRIGEILGLRWQDIQWSTNQVFVRQQYYRGQFAPPKSKKAVRRIDVRPSLMQALKAYQHLKSLELDLVFCTKDGKPLDDGNLIKRHFKPALRKAGLRGIRFHDLRHTNASIRLAAGQTPKYISEQMGHSTVQFTMDTYVHIIPTHREQEANKLESLLFGNILVTFSPEEEKKHLAISLSA
jgi:integrase